MKVVILSLGVIFFFLGATGDLHARSLNQEFQQALSAEGDMTTWKWKLSGDEFIRLTNENVNELAKRTGPKQFFVWTEIQNRLLNHQIELNRPFISQLMRASLCVPGGASHRAVSTSLAIALERKGLEFFDILKEEAATIPKDPGMQNCLKELSNKKFTEKDVIVSLAQNFQIVWVTAAQIPESVKKHALSFLKRYHRDPSMEIFLKEARWITRSY